MSGNAGANNNQPGDGSNANQRQQSQPRTEEEWRVLASLAAQMGSEIYKPSTEFDLTNIQASQNPGYMKQAQQEVEDRTKWLASQQTHMLTQGFEPNTRFDLSNIQASQNPDHMQQAQQAADERARWLEAQQAQIANRDFAALNERTRWLASRQNQVQQAFKAAQAQNGNSQASVAGNNGMPHHTPLPAAGSNNAFTAGNGGASGSVLPLPNLPTPGSNRMPSVADVSMLDLFKANRQLNRQQGVPPVSNADNPFVRPGEQTPVLPQVRGPFIPPVTGANNNIISHQGPNPAMPPPPPIRRAPRPSAPGMIETQQAMSHGLPPASDYGPGPHYRKKATMLRLCHPVSSVFATAPDPGHDNINPCYVKLLQRHRDSWCEVLVTTKVSLVTPTWGEPGQAMRRCPSQLAIYQSRKEELLAVLHISATMIDRRKFRDASPESDDSNPASTPSPPRPQSQLRETLTARDRPNHVRVIPATATADRGAMIEDALVHLHPGNTNGVNFPDVLVGDRYLADEAHLRSAAGQLLARANQGCAAQGGVVNAMKRSLRKNLRWSLAMEDGDPAAAELELDVAKFNGAEGDFIGAVRELNEDIYTDALFAGLVKLQKEARQYFADMNPGFLVTDREESRKGIMAAAPTHAGVENDRESISSETETISFPRFKQTYRSAHLANPRHNPTNINKRNRSVQVINHHAGSYGHDEPHPPYSTDYSKRARIFESRSSSYRLSHRNQPKPDSDSIHDAQRQRRSNSTRHGKEVLREIETASGVKIIQNLPEPGNVDQIDDTIESEKSLTSSLDAAELWRLPWPVRPGSVYSRASSVFDTSSTNRSRSSAPSDISEASVDTFQPPVNSRPAGYALPCEFSHIANCKEQFPVEQFDEWIEHIADIHLHRVYPDRSTCWFFDDVEFVATASQGVGAETNFRNRMAHIRDHIAQGALNKHKGRPDWEFLEHLWRNGLIAERIYRIIKGYKERQTVDEEVSWDFRSNWIPNDMTNENRKFKRHKVHQEIEEDRAASLARSSHGEDNKPGAKEYGVFKEPPSRNIEDSRRTIGGNASQPGRGTTTSQPKNNQDGTICTTLQKHMEYHYTIALAWVLWPYQWATSIFWPRIPSGYRRVRWNCRCGKPLYLDFADAEMGPALAYAQSASGGSSPVSVSGSAPGGLRRDDSISSMHTQQTVSTNMTENESNGTPPTETQETPNYPPALAQDTRQYLLLCVKTGSNQIKLAQVDLTYVVDNAILYHRIRTEYHQLRPQTRRNIFLVPTRVEYVNFELIQRRQTGECVGNYRIDSIPSIKEVMSRQYAFWPCPPTIGTVPIQSHIFMHSFLTPGDHGTTRDFERLPKKVNTKLACSAGATNARQVPMGWGIYIVEDLNTPLLASLLLVILLLVLIVTTIWSIHKDDIQGGMGIGQFAIAFVTGVLATGALRNKASLGTV